MAGLTVDGFEPKALQTILQEMQDAVHAGVSPTLDLSSRSLLGQLLGVTASQIAQVWEACSDTYAARDLEQAAGAALAELCANNNVLRRAATFSTVLVDLDLDAGTYAAGALVAHVSGSPESRFSNDAEITGHPGGPLASVPFTAEEAGEVRANAGTLTVIADPIVGFNSVTNPAEAVLGLAEEKDADLRLRYFQTLGQAGSRTLPALLARVRAVAGVTYVQVFENDTDDVVDGMPPHSVEVLVLGGTDADVAQAIYDVKADGVQAYGTTEVPVVDSQGESHTIGLTRPTDVDLEIVVNLTAVAGAFAGATAVKQALTDWFDLEQAIGHDVIRSRMESVVLSVPGTVDAAVLIDAVGGTPVSASYVIGTREIARLDQPDITVNVTLLPGRP